MTKEEKRADRANAGKTKWSLVEFQSFQDMVRVLEYGEKKYSRDNWKLGLPISEIIDSLMRHMVSFMNGMDVDEETKICHVAHMQCNLMFLKYIIDNDDLRSRFDDRKTNDTLPF